jgi:hypothetical protein
MNLNERRKDGISDGNKESSNRIGNLRRATQKFEVVEPSEIQRRQAAAEYLKWAWPADRKGSHRAKDCMRPIKLDKGTAAFPKAKDHQK